MRAFRDVVRRKVAAWLVTDRRGFSVPLFDFERTREALRPADVLLVEGCSRVSTIIRQMTQSTWTHSALYLGRLHELEPAVREKIVAAYPGEPDPSEPLLIESLLGEGTIVAPLSKYRHNHLRICRPVGLSAADNQQVIAYMAERLGSRYGTGELLESALLLLLEGVMPGRRSRAPASRARRVEGSICSSMLGQAFMSVGLPVLPTVDHNGDGKPYRSVRAFHRLTPRDFDHSPSFQIIKSPLDDGLRHVLVRMAMYYAHAGRRARAAQGTARPDPVTSGKRTPRGWAARLARRRGKEERTVGSRIPETDTGAAD